MIELPKSTPSNNARPALERLVQGARAGVVPAVTVSGLARYTGVTSLSGRWPKDVSYRRRQFAAIAITIALMAGCASTTSPTLVAQPTPAVTSAPQATSLTSSQPSEDPSIAPAGLQRDTIAVTVSDRLRVRSEPRVSADSIKYEPVLPLGTELVILDGPVEDSGYTWYPVRPLAFSGLDGPGLGWVAMADKNGEPWIAPASASGASSAWRSPPCHVPPPTPPTRSVLRPRSMPLASTSIGGWSPTRSSTWAIETSSSRRQASHWRLPWPGAGRRAARPARWTACFIG